MKNKRKIFSFILCLTIILGSMPLISNNSFKATENEWNFGYTGSVQEWTAPYTGKYYLDIYGAGSTGSSNVTFNGGGHTEGYINLVAGEKLYIAVGEKGVINGPATYNGGGKGGNGATAGSGATSITTTNRGELYNFENYKSEIIAVAGGSGGQGSLIPNGSVGPGGGTTGLGINHDSDEANGKYDGHWGHESTGGTQTTGYSFGKGQDYCTTAENQHGEGGYGGAGGGGFYGGTNSKCGNLPGGGGSGYVNTSIFYDSITNLSTHKGNGSAKIKFIGEVYTDLVIDLNGHGTYNGQEGVVFLNNKYGESIEINTPVSTDGYKFVGWKIIYGSVKPETGSYTYDFNDSYIIAQWAAPMTVKTDIDITAYNNKGGMNFNVFQEDELEKVMTIQQSVDGTNFYNVFENNESKNPTVYRKQFNYTGGSQTYAAPKDGLYKLEVYGSNSIYNQGYQRNQYYETSVGGGYSVGYTSLKNAQKLYVSVGGPNNLQYGGWNGGGNGKLTRSVSHINGETYDYSTGGAGATHISTQLIGDGQLKYYSNNRNSVLLVAGGAGGGVGWTSGGSGGGITGGTGQAYTCGPEGYIDLGLRGGNQSYGYAFGQGQSAGNGYKTGEFHGGGGGGWYGGQAYTGTWNAYWSLNTGGCGGSGHIGNVLNGSMSAGLNKGAGYAIITLSQEYISGSIISGIYTPDTAAPNIPSNGNYDSEGNTITITWQGNGDNGTNYWHKISSYIKDDESISGLGMLLNEETVKDNITTGVKGFYYYIDNKSTGTVTKNHTFTENAEIEVPTATSDRYLHVAAVDGAGNISGTYTMLIPSIAKYTVNHYAQNEDGSYVLVKTEEFMDTIGKTVTPEVHPQTGRDNPPIQSIVITADGKTVVNYYYDVTRFDINGTVQWNDHNNIYGTRPEDIKVTLYRDGEYFDEVIVSAANNSNGYSFPGVQKYDLETGREFVYTVEQETAYSQAALATSEDKYLTRQSGFNFLNTINNTNADKPDKPDPDNPDDKGFYVEGDIYWNDNNDSLGFRPSTVTITLYQKGEDGEFVEFDSVVVDANNENHYLFDWLPKYWYDEDGVPTKYEYKVEETFTAWYVEDGVIKDAYEIHPDSPKDCDFTNDFVFPSGPIIPVNEYTNTLTVVTDTDEPVRVILKPEELIVNSDYSVSYGDPTGDDILSLVDKTGEVLTDLPSTRYEIIVDSPEYTIDDITLTLPENMRLEKVGDKWYLVIENQPGDAIGTLEIELTKKEVFYQDRSRISNYFACPSGLSDRAAVIRAMSLFSITADEELDSEITDKNMSEENLSDSLEFSEDILETTEELQEENDNEEAVTEDQANDLQISEDDLE